jgi:Protein of unknown function (DUF3631)
VSNENNNTPEEPVDRKIEIERLAGLNVIDYEAARSRAAERLGMRAHVLDKQVKKTQRTLGHDEDAEDRQGRLVKITDILPWPEMVDGDHLLTELAVLPDHAADAIALWTLHTWVVTQFGISPRLAVTSPTKGCGKTTIIRILNKVTRRPKRAGSISPPALFRAMEQFQPTILLDETEKYIEHGSDLHALMNEGHCKGATVMRVLGEKLELIEFRIFGAAAFCRNGKIPDDLEQRSIVIEMQRRLPGEPLAELRDDRCEALDRIARKCARWADNNANALKDADPDMGGLINRIADNWRPLYAIADLIGSDWPERARKAAVALAPRESDSTNTQLLADIKAIFDERTGDWADRVFSEMLVEALAGMEGHPWAEYGKARKPITKNQLARVLGSFHVTPATVQIGTKTLKGYYRHQFNDAWERYLASQGVHETSERQNATAADTSGPFGNVSDESVPTDKKCEKPPSNGHSDGLTLPEGENAPVCAQCTAADDGTLQRHGEVWLHPECVRFWPKDDLDIPGFLDRRQQTRGQA